MRICRLEDSSFAYADVVELIKVSFVQWQEKGLDSSLLKLTPDSFAEKTANDVVLVAIDDNNDTLCGTTSFSIVEDKQGKRYAYNKFSAVTNNTKQKGIGSSLLEYEKQIALNERCRYILSDTCVHAKWSIKWHKKNGFKRVGLLSFKNNKYYSYLFRCQLTSPSKWNCFLYRCIRFWCSFLKTKIWLRSDGSHTRLAQFVISFLNQLFS